MAWKCVIYYDINNDDYQVALIDKLPTGEKAWVLPMQQELVARGEFNSREPWLQSTITGESQSLAVVQAIMDAAWEHGMRPAGFADHKWENDAMRHHMSDLRKLVGKSYDVDLGD